MSAVTRRRRRYGTRATSLLMVLAIAGCRGTGPQDDDGASASKRLFDRVILEVPAVDSTSPRMVLRERSTHKPPALFLGATFPSVPGLVVDAWIFESHVTELVRTEILPSGALVIRSKVRDHPAELETVATPRRDAVDLVATWIPAEGTPTPAAETVGPLDMCYQLRFAPRFGSHREASEPYPAFAVRGFLFRGLKAVSLEHLHRSSRMADRPDKAYTDRWDKPDGTSEFFPWVQGYLPSWHAPASEAAVPGPGFSRDRFDQPLIGLVSRDGRHLTALAAPDATSAAQLWHDCLHLRVPWRLEAPEDDPDAARLTWRTTAYAMPNDPDALLERFAKDFPGALRPARTLAAPAAAHDDG